MKNKSLEALNCYKIIRLICFVLAYSTFLKGVALFAKGDSSWVLGSPEFNLAFSIASIVAGLGLLYGLHRKKPALITYSLAATGCFYCVLALLNAFSEGAAPTGLFSISVICILIAAYFKNEKSEDSP